MRSPSRAAGALLAIGVAFALLALGATISRSLIPHEIDGTVAAVEVRREKHPGVDDVWLVHFDDGRRLHADADVARHLSADVALAKAVGETQLRVDDAPVDLALSRDAVGMLWVLPLTLLSAAAAAASSLRPIRLHR
jgi:hypothetical protein